MKVLNSTKKMCAISPFSLNGCCGVFPFDQIVGKCKFAEDGKDLKDAVDKYHESDDEKKKIETKYGEIGNWDVSKVEIFDNLFKDKITFNEEIYNWDTSSATRMAGMFYGCKEFKQDISK